MLSYIGGWDLEPISAAYINAMPNDTLSIQGCVELSKKIIFTTVSLLYNGGSCISRLAKAYCFPWRISMLLGGPCDHAKLVAVWSNECTLHGWHLIDAKYWTVQISTSVISSIWMSIGSLLHSIPFSYEISFGESFFVITTTKEKRIDRRKLCWWLPLVSHWPGKRIFLSKETMFCRNNTMVHPSYFPEDLPHIYLLQRSLLVTYWDPDTGLFRSSYESVWITEKLCWNTFQVYFFILWSPLLI